MTRHGGLRRRYSLRDLLDAESPGGRGLLAAEVLQRTGRQDGPRNHRCEVCGQPAERFTLQDWEHWACPACAERAYRASLEPVRATRTGTCPDCGHALADHTAEWNGCHHIDRRGLLCPCGMATEEAT